MRKKVGSGLTIRYGEPIPVAKYREQYQRDEEGAVRAVMDEITVVMKRICPYFSTMELLTTGRRLVEAGICASIYRASALVREATEAGVLQALEAKAHEFFDASKEKHIPLWAWGENQKWKLWSLSQRLAFIVTLPIGVLLFLWDLVHNLIAEYPIRRISNLLASDETEYMTYRMGLTPFLIWPIYAIQYFVFPQIFLRFVPVPNLGYWGYVVMCTGIWYATLLWKRHLITLAARIIYGRKMKHAKELSELHAALSATK
jgi:hypothetical protein